MENNTLFAPNTFAQQTVKNRFALSPMTRINADEDGTPTEKMKSYYSSFAKNDFGLIITEGTYIDEEYSQTYFNQPGITNEKHINGWKQIIDSVHAFDSKIIIQIQHAGALSQGNYYQTKTLGPSAIQPKGSQLEFYNGNGPYQIPIPASKEHLDKVIGSFAQAALNAKIAGADGVEIHGANGYLLDQFLTDYTNQRSDQYGGSTQNRVLLLTQVIDAVRESVGNDFVVGIRISQGKVNDYFHKWDGDQDANIIFTALASTSLDYIHITEFKVSDPAFSDHQYTRFDKGSSLTYIAKTITNLPIVANGQIDSLESSIQTIEHDRADMIAIGKAALANHDFVKKIQAGSPLDAFDAEKILRPLANLKDFELL